jgi:hypothetical protein
MVSRTKILTTVIILLLLSVLLSGCTEKKIVTATDSIQKDSVESVLFSGCSGEKNIAQEPDSTQKETVDVSSQNLNKSPKEENIPDISIASFSSIYMYDNSDNEDIYLFSWENVPGNESNRLLSFLKNNLQIEWVTNAQITKDDMNNTIRVFANENSIEIILYPEISDMRIGNMYDRRVREENGTYKVYDIKYRNKYDISERCYALYDLSIKNNGSNIIDFKLKGLRLQEGDRIFNATTFEPNADSGLEVLDDLENKNKLQDTVLLPGQSLNGIVAFRVNSLYNRSFLLKYKTITVDSASFEKSTEALGAAENFNYSTALGIPPYINQRERSDYLIHLYQERGISPYINQSVRGVTAGSYVPVFDDFCDIWANWVNRSIFETFQKSDVERMRKSPPDDITSISMVYALRVIPERNITMYPVTTTTNLVVIDDTGEEMINTSNIEEMAVMSNMTYTYISGSKSNFPGMNFSNSSVVRISFLGRYYTSGRVSITNQDVILDDKLNIIVVRNHLSQLIS